LTTASLAADGMSGDHPIEVIEGRPEGHCQYDHAVFVRLEAYRRGRPGPRAGAGKLGEFRPASSGRPGSKSAGDILETLADYCQRIIDSGR